MTVVKELTFDAAHVLSNYNGKCNNLHGHTYRARVAISADVVNDMVLDFNTIKEIFEPYDHAVVFGGVNEREPFEQGLLELVQTYKKRHVIMPDNMRPTAENMVKVAIESIKAKVPGVRSVAIEIWETPTSYAAEEWTK